MVSKKPNPYHPFPGKICKGVGITLSQFFAEGEDTLSLTQEQREMLDSWSSLNEKQQEIFLALLKAKGE